MASPPVTMNRVIPYWPLSIVAMLGVVASIGASVFVAGLERARNTAEFRAVAQQPVSAIQREIQAHLGAVEALAAFFNGSEEVERGEFGPFAAAMRASHSSVLAFEWAPRVAASERELFEQRTRDEGHLGFRITERATAGRIVSAGRRDDYYPVAYVEPERGNEEVLGFDVASEGDRRDTLERARDSGTPGVTPPIELVQATSARWGFLRVVPIYDRRLPTATAAQRRAALSGYVVGVFDIARLITAAMSPVRAVGSAAPAEFDVRVYDEAGGREGADGTSLLLFANSPDGSQATGESADPATFRTNGVLDLTGRRWQIVVSTSRLFPGVEGRQLPWVVLLAGLGLTAIAVPVYQSRRRGSARLEELARSLDEKNRTLEDISLTLSAYLPAQVYRSICLGEHDGTMPSKRKKLTVMFADIEDFTDLTADLDPEELTFLLNEYITEMSAIATEHGATIDKFVGDGMLLFFGDPDTLGVAVDAQACVRAAMAMQRRTAELAEAWREQGYEWTFRMRIGISSGYCNVGNFGGQQRMAYTIIGGTVNKAERLQGICEPGGIALASETHALVKDHFDIEAGAPVQLRGSRTESVPYWVRGIYDAESIRALSAATCRATV